MLILLNLQLKNICIVMLKQDLRINVLRSCTATVFLPVQRFKKTHPMLKYIQIVDLFNGDI